MARRRRRRTAIDPDWLERAHIAADALLEISKLRDDIACYRCGRTKAETKLWFFMTTGEDDEISRGRPAVIVACSEHDPNDV